MRSRLIKLALTCAIFTLAGSCSLYDNYEAGRPANIMELEARLVTAGFRRVPIETPEQNGAVAALLLHRLNRYQSATGSVYWYADPTVCHCLYEGDQKAYDNYAGILQQQNDTAEYVNDVEPEQVAGLSPFGYVFPAPVLLGGWPVMIPGGGSPIHSVGHPGGGPISHAGHGGGGHGGFGHGGGGHR
jgi:hypothetical protein